MITVLLVAEKPSLAESIAKFLAKGKINTRRSVACNVHEYEGKFFGKPAKFKVTSVMGHVFSVDFPAEYNNWNAVNPEDLFSAPILKSESNPKQHIVKHLQVEGKGIDYLVLWLDADREGENICFEVISVVKPYMNKPEGNKGKNKNIYRAKFSAVTSVEINAAMQKLGAPNANEAKAVDIRQELDLKIGRAFTRFQTKYFQGKYGNMDSSILSFGPCQTPTLALCVRRHDEILSFEPKKFWTIRASVEIKAGGQLNLTSERGRIWEKKKAADIREQLKNITSASRPNALNTVEMLKIGSKMLGYSPQHTMQVAERLYMQGYVSYPRTETSKYPESYDIKATLEMLSVNPLWGTYAKELAQNGFNRNEGGKSFGDHDPICPTKNAPEYDLGGDAWRLYDYICRHFIATNSPNCNYNRINVKLRIGNELSPP
ncbi:hypothetical protein MP638_003903 [Amoeboaphelidium occidentale]|nr:hypothetical protein MP638_003903 [Amoeboaphelidium occidentale]